MRTGHLDADRSAALRIRFLDDVASGAITLIAVGERHYAAAERLIVRYGDRHGLRTLDALPLAVALEVQRRIGSEVLAADKILCEVAALEGPVVFNPEFQ